MHYFPISNKTHAFARLFGTSVFFTQGHRCLVICYLFQRCSCFILLKRFSVNQNYFSLCNCMYVNSIYLCSVLLLGIRHKAFCGCGFPQWYQIFKCVSLLKYVNFWAFFAHDLSNFQDIRKGITLTLCKILSWFGAREEVSCLWLSSKLFFLILMV